MKTVEIRFLITAVGSESIEVEDNFELQNPDGCDTWEDLCYFNPEMDMDYANDLKLDGYDLDVAVISMDITDKDGNREFEMNF